MEAVLRIQCFFDPWIQDQDPVSGIGKNSDLRSGINISDVISESTVKKICIKFFVNSVMLIRIREGKIRIRERKIQIWDGKIQIRDKHPGSATL
jgi:hypothetical protein